MALHHLLLIIALQEQDRSQEWEFQLLLLQTDY